MNRTIFVIVAAFTATALEAQAPDEAPQGVIDIGLSPSGDRVAYLVGAGRSTEALYVADLAETGGIPKPILVHPDKASGLRYCRWANDRRLVCRIDFTSDGEGNPQQFSRMFAMSAEGDGFVALNVEDIRGAAGGRQAEGTVLALGPGGRAEKILMTRNWTPGFLTTTRVSQDETGLGVEEIDLATGERRRIEPPDPSVAGYAADEQGKVRFKVVQPLGPPGAAAAERSYFFRDGRSDSWRRMAVEDGDAGTTDFRPVAVDASKSLVYGYIVSDGRKAAASLTLADEGKLEILLRNDASDAGRFVTLGRERRVVGAMQAGDSSETVYFDKDLRDLASGLRQALPGGPSISISGSSDDANRLLIVAAEGGDAAMAYLFERDTRRLSEVMPVRLPAPAMIADGM